MSILDKLEKIMNETEYASDEFTSMLSAMLGGNKNALSAYHKHNGLDKIPKYKRLLIQYEEAKKKYDKLFKDGKLKKNVTPEQFEELKNNLDVATKEMMEFKGSEDEI